MTRARHATEWVNRKCRRLLIIPKLESLYYKSPKKKCLRKTCATTLWSRFSIRIHLLKKKSTGVSTNLGIVPELRSAVSWENRWPKGGTTRRTVIDMKIFIGEFAHTNCGTFSSEPSHNHRREKSWGNYLAVNLFNRAIEHQIRYIHQIVH